jgi:hypothetical protein
MSERSMFMTSAEYIPLSRLDVKTYNLSLVASESLTKSPVIIAEIMAVAKNAKRTSQRICFKIFGVLVSFLIN